MRIRTAILGYGRSGSTLHATALESLPDFEVVAVCDVVPQRLAQAKQRFRCRTYDNYHEMLEKEELDLVSIVTRSDQHAVMACDCLKAGVNVLVTKPWCINEGEAQQMVQAARESGKLLAPWLPARWGTDLIRLKAIIAAGTIGRVFFVRRGVYSFMTRDDWQTEKRYGGGYILNWGPHLVDQPLQLIGSKVASVYGQAGKVMNPGDAEDWFMALLLLENGVRVQVEFNVALKGLPNWFIQGDKGTIVVDGSEITVYSASPFKPTDPTLHQKPSAPPVVTKETVGKAIYGDGKEIYSELAAALRGKKVFPVTPASALYLTRVLDAIKLSSEENRIITLC